MIAALHEEWGEAQGNYDEFRFFTGMRPSEQIALTISDVDVPHAVLNINKARVAGVDRDRTKTGDDRRVALCPRAVAVLRRQFRLRERLVCEGRIDHGYLFFQPTGKPILGLREVYSRWQRTLKRLPIRYRKPYAARHSSVSWNLMVGQNPLWVAKQHGHSLWIMLTVYAAWVHGAAPVDIAAIRRSLRNRPQEIHVNIRSTRSRPAENGKERPSDLAVDLAVTSGPGVTRAWKTSIKNGGADGTLKERASYCLKRISAKRTFQYAPQRALQPSVLGTSR